MHMTSLQKFSRCSASALIAALIASAGFVRAQPVVSSLDVIAPFGLGFSATWGLNNSGQVAVMSNEEGVLKAVIWTPGGITEITDTLSGGGATVYVADINDAGQVTGSINNGAQVFVWSEGVMTEIANPVGSGQMFPSAINNSGGVVSEVSTALGTTLVKSSGGAAVTLQTAPETNAQVQAINDAGHSVGSAFNIGANLNQATIWDEEGNASLVATPNMSGDSFANAINNNGVVVGSFTNDLGFTTTEAAFIWDGTTAINLGSLLASEFQSSVAYDVNDFGHVVGVAYGAFVYMDGVLYALEDLAADLMVEEGTTSGFVALNVAYDINNLGQIVGSGDYYDSETGMTHDMGFMLSLSNVPEPSASGALAGLVALGAVTLRRRRRG